MFDQYGSLLLLGQRQQIPHVIPKNVTSIWKKTSKVDSRFRVHDVMHLSGDYCRQFSTVENGFRVYFSLDTYYNGRYSSERQQLAGVLRGNTLAIIGAGVGVYSLYLHKNFNSICNFEINSDCGRFFMKNMLENKVFNSSFIQSDSSVVLKRKKVLFSHYLIVLPLCVEQSLSQVKLIIFKHRIVIKPHIVLYLHGCDKSELFTEAVEFWASEGYTFEKKHVKTYSPESDISRITICKLH